MSDCTDLESMFWLLKRKSSALKFPKCPSEVLEILQLNRREGLFPHQSATPDCALGSWVGTAGKASGSPSSASTSPDLARNQVLVQGPLVGLGSDSPKRQPCHPLPPACSLSLYFPSPVEGIGGSLSPGILWRGPSFCRCLEQPRLSREPEVKSNGLTKVGGKRRWQDRLTQLLSPTPSACSRSDGTLHGKEASSP